MSAHAVVRTAEELLRMPDDGMRHELIAGELLTMPPVGVEHGRVAANTVALLFVHAHATVGVALGEAGFVLATDPDTVRAPDAAFISQARADAIGRTFKYWPEAPDLAIEVVSPDDRPREVDAKAREWVTSGARAVLVLEPRTRTATVYRPGAAMSAHRLANGPAPTPASEDEAGVEVSGPLGADAVLDLDDAVPGWRVTVSELFL